MGREKAPENLVDFYDNTTKMAFKLKPNGFLAISSKEKKKKKRPEIFT